MASQHPSPSGPPSGAVADLPVAATAVASFASVFGQIGLVVQAAKGALAMLVGAWLISLALPGGGGTAFFMILVSLAASSHFGVNWCRVMLLGPQGLPARSLSWGEVHWRFFGYGMLLFLITVLMTIPLSIIGSFIAAVLGLVPTPEQAGPGVIVVFLLVFLGALYILARLGFVFPAVAAGENYGLGLSWQHTAGQGFRLTAALFAVAFPITIAQLVITELLAQGLLGRSMMDMLPSMPTTGEGLPPGAPAPGATLPAEPPAGTPSKLTAIVFNLISSLVNFVSFAIVFSLLCLAFRTCTGWVPAQSGLPSAPPPDDD